MAKNRVFFPQKALDLWLSEGRIDLTGDELTLKAEGRTFRITEAVRVLREVTGTPDAYDLVGRVKSRVFLDALESELLETSMLIGDNAYDVVPGFLGIPQGTFAEHMAQSKRTSAPEAKSPTTDEELLALFLAREP
ncbi:MAG: hypothetical protein RMJ98_02615 [Myxococcales bacterium]|nr:hypothetical protein [Polyangiaceae bacterium]MDW8248182.1 hypothetical protein [Myxococcales bacterium]